MNNGASNKEKGEEMSSNLAFPGLLLGGKGRRRKCIPRRRPKASDLIATLFLPNERVDRWMDGWAGEGRKGEEGWSYDGFSGVWLKRREEC